MSAIQPSESWNNHSFEEVETYIKGDISGLRDDLQNATEEINNRLDNCVDLTSEQTINAVKTFSSGISMNNTRIRKVKTPTAKDDAANKQYVDESVLTKPDTFILSSDRTMAEAVNAINKKMFIVIKSPRQDEGQDEDYGYLFADYAYVRDDGSPAFIFHYIGRRTVYELKYSYSQMEDKWKMSEMEYPIPDYDYLVRLSGKQTITGEKTFSAGIDLNGTRISKVGYPVNTDDAANKKYVDTQVKTIDDKVVAFESKTNFSYLEAITIYTDNTPEHRQANINNIAAYEDNLQKLGVDTSKGVMIPINVDGKQGYIQYSDGINFGSPETYFGVVCRSSEYFDECYFIRIIKSSSSPEISGQVNLSSKILQNDDNFGYLLTGMSIIDTLNVLWENYLNARFEKLTISGGSTPIEISADKTYLSHKISFDAGLSGPEDISGGKTILSNIQNPVSASDAATKDYVDNTIKIANNAVQITYAELKSLRDVGKLVPGTQYRITDYTCTTTQSGTKSAGHVFDIIVTADDKSALNEVARAVKHDGDTYFANSNLSAWRLWYCLDNDTDRFAWADATNGKGVIYRMIDEWNNDVPYDFKNIKFARWELSNSVGYRNDFNYDTWEDNWIQESTPFDSLKRGFWGLSSADNKFYYIYDSTEGIYKYKVEYTISESPTYYYTFGKNTDYSINGSNYSNVIKEYRSGNKIQLNNIVFLSSDCYSNSFDINCHSNTFDENCHNNAFGENCHNNTFGKTEEYDESADKYIIFGCTHNTFDGNCYNNTFIGNCNYNNFGYECYDNNFGNHSYEFAENTGCNNNTFGNECYENCFGNMCHKNTFGNNCYDNIFVDYCSSNIFGNDCCYNTFDLGCGNNSFGNDCGSNSFGNNCGYNSFGNDCGSNSFGNNCGSNSFGNDCNYIKFASDSSASTKYNYYRRNHFGDGCQYIVFTGAETASSSAQVQNYNFAQGLQGTDSAYLTIDGARNLSYETKVAKNSNGEIKIYCEADLIL